MRAAKEWNCASKRPMLGVNQELTGIYCVAPPTSAGKAPDANDSNMMQPPLVSVLVGT